jgi:hypothetical protein
MIRAIVLRTKTCYSVFKSGCWSQTTWVRFWFLIPSHGPGIVTLCSVCLMFLSCQVSPRVLARIKILDLVHVKDLEWAQNKSSVCRRCHVPIPLADPFVLKRNVLFAGITDFQGRVCGLLPWKTGNNWTLLRRTSAGMSWSRTTATWCP